MSGIEFFEYDRSVIHLALATIKSARLYKPGDGIIGRMTRVTSEYDLDKIIIAFDNGIPIGCIVCDIKRAMPSWSSWSTDRSVPNLYTRINVWIKPKYRRKGIGRKLMVFSGVKNQLGVECYNTGPASENLYKCLEKARFI